MTAKHYIRSYGCQMNAYDAERMSEAMEGAGYAAVGTPEDADLVILNTCHIREKAAEKVYSEIGRLKALKAARPGMRIAVAGCVAQAEGEEILSRADAVDLVVGPQAYHRLPDLVARAGRGERPVDTDFPVEDKFDHMGGRRRAAPVSAFLTVQEGCDKFCAFCVVPYTRGAEFSRPVDRVLSEARDLVAAGAREVTLLGQNVNAYHGQGPDGRDWSLARLIAALAEIEGLARIRYTTSHPNDFTDDLIAAHRDVGKLMPYLHLPVQSGSDSVLKRMNRRHSAGDYLRLIERIRAARPDILLSGDFIVGFPGETEADFEATLDLVRAVGYGQCYSFKYSPRPGTPAAERAPVPEAVRSDRLARLQALLAEQQRDALNACVGTSQMVLFEKAGRRDGQVLGKNPHQMAVHADGPERLIGTEAPVTVVSGESHSLTGQLTAA